MVPRPRRCFQRVVLVAAYQCTNVGQVDLPQILTSCLQLPSMRGHCGFNTVVLSNCCFDCLLFQCA